MGRFTSRVYKKAKEVEVQNTKAKSKKENKLGALCIPGGYPVQGLLWAKLFRHSHKYIHGT